MSRAVSAIGDIALAFMERGGKRLRPRLCRAAWLVATNGSSPAALRPVEDAVECFHKASLIHDDIQDGDEERYGRPAVWKEHGVAVAIAAGDWLVANGYRLISASGFAAVPQMLAATVESHLRLCEGQGDDLLGGDSPDDPARYLAVCAGKTAEAFALAAQLGALAAGVDAAPYREWAMTFGTLFQIEDDMADNLDAPFLEELRADWMARMENADRALPLLRGRMFGQ